MTLWIPISQAPKDGTPFWGFLHDMGIRKLKWSNPEEAAAQDGGEAEDYEGAFVDVRDITSDWHPKWFAHLHSIPEPPNA